MLLKIIAVLSVISVTASFRIPRSAAAVIPILKSELGTGTDGEYTYAYEGADGTYRREKSVPMNVGEEDEYLAIFGSYRYIDGQGITVEVHYTAGPEGFVITDTNVGESIETAGKKIEENLVNGVKPSNKEKTSRIPAKIQDSADLIAPDYSDNSPETSEDADVPDS